MKPLRGTQAAADETPAARDLREALASLSAIRVARPELDEPGRVLADLITASFSRTDRVAAEGPSPGQFELVSSLLPSDQPWFLRVEPALDWGVVASRITAMCSQLPQSAGGRRINQLLEGRADRMPGLVAWVFTGGTAELPAGLDDLAPEGELLRSLLRLALMPSLSIWSARFEDVLAKEEGVSGRCPFCGDSPAIAELRGLDRKLFLRCSTCASSWPGLRTACPSCGETRPRQLAYIASEGEHERARLLVCQSCESRVVLISTLRASRRQGFWWRNWRRLLIG